jgi:hypothetical protein
MFTKSILAVATAAVLSAGAIAATTSAADAHYSNGYYVTKTISVPKTICKTFYENDLVGYDYYNQPIYKSVPYEKCETIYVNEYEKVFVPTYNSYNSYNSYSHHYGY